MDTQFLAAWLLMIPFSWQIHNRYEGKDISNHKRNLVIAGGVTLSVIVSPVVAAVTVGQSTLQTLSPSSLSALQNICKCLEIFIDKSLFC